MLLPRLVPDGHRDVTSCQTHANSPGEGIPYQSDGRLRAVSLLLENPRGRTQKLSEQDIRGAGRARRAVKPRARTHSFAPRARLAL